MFNFRGNMEGVHHTIYTIMSPLKYVAPTQAKIEMTPLRTILSADEQAFAQQRRK